VIRAVLLSLRCVDPVLGVERVGGFTPAIGGRVRTVESAVEVLRVRGDDTLQFRAQLLHAPFSAKIKHQSAPYHCLTGVSDTVLVSLLVDVANRICGELEENFCSQDY
jgi:hypothetical protein